MLTARQILGLFIVLRRRHREDTGLLSLRRKLTTYWPGHSSQETDGSTQQLVSIRREQPDCADGPKRDADDCFRQEFNTDRPSTNRGTADRRHAIT